MNESQFREDINMAKLAILNKKNFAFFGSILYKLVPVMTDRGTIALDGSSNKMYINANWFNGLSHEHKASALAHEALHYALQHDIRMGRKNPDLYQKACDEVVNNLLMDCSFSLPHDVPVNRHYQNQSTELVYKQVEQDFHDNNRDKNDLNNDNPFGNDLPRNQPNISQNSINERNRVSNQADLANQMATGKSMGTSSDTFAEFFKNINEGKLDWKTILSEHFNELTQGEPSYHDLDRRLLSLGYYEPVNESENKVKRVALALDVSGSITEQQIQIFLNEIKAIATNLEPEEIHVMTFNTGIVNTFSLKEPFKFNEIKLDIGGGTNLKPVFKYYNEKDNIPDFLVVLSDLECTPIKVEPTYPVIWLCFDNERAETHFGKLIHIKTEDLE